MEKLYLEEALWGGTVLSAVSALLLLYEYVTSFYKTNSFATLNS
jgi:hypothetical protein